MTREEACGLPVVLEEGEGGGFRSTSGADSIFPYHHLRHRRALAEFPPDARALIARIDERIGSLVDQVSEWRYSIAMWHYSGLGSGEVHRTWRDVFVQKYTADDECESGLANCPHVDHSTLSVSCALTRNHSGGLLAFDLQGVAASLEDPGTCLLCLGGPSHPHRVGVVTAGTRYALVMQMRVIPVARRVDPLYEEPTQESRHAGSSWLRAKYVLARNLVWSSSLARTFLQRDSPLAVPEGALAGATEMEEEAMVVLQLTVLASGLLCFAVRWWRYVRGGRRPRLDAMRARRTHGD
jgi:hypothetical protein